MIQQSSAILPSQKLPKKTQNLLKNLKGYSTMLNSSSKFWSDPLTNSNFCSCGCNKDLIIEEENDNNEIKKNKDSLFKIIQKNEEEKKSFTKEWTKEEHDLLYNEYFKKGNKNMKYIYNLLQSKSIQQINYRIKKIELKNKVRSFTRQDDLKIIELVEIYGLNWVAIANNFPGFKAEALEERYYNKLDPKLKRTKFTEEEDEKIINLYLKFGNNWKEISNYFEDRNANMIKNRFYSFLKKKKNIQNYANSSSYLSDKDLSSASISNNSVNNDNDLLKDINNDIKFEFNNLNFDDFNNNDNNNNSNPFFNNKLLIDDNIKVVPLNDDYYYSNNNINYHKDFSNNSSNGSSANNKNINNNLNDEKFNQTFLKVFNNKYDEIDNNNNQMNIDENELLINYENNNEEKEQLLNESQRLEEILSKIDKINNNNNNINNNYNINNNINIDNNNMNIEENNNDDKILYNDLIKYNNKINNIQILLKKKLYLLKENQDDFNKEKITEINDVLLKLISIGKAKIMINLKLKDLQKNKINI